MTKIETEIQYNWAVERVEELLPLVDETTPETDRNYIELNLLSNLVADYSEIHFAIGEPKLQDVLQLRMYELGLTQKRMSELLEVSQSRISEYLTGKSEPTLKTGRIISKRLNIDPAIVLGV
ncbi:helix-turn-helix domain-containing protein [Kaistella sp.]|uniref:helix-turn-helix domain-containing protein n=1 Tax=Kaistella sp. TaxID=2782235 RepID=UPI003C3DEA22